VVFIVGACPSIVHPGCTMIFVVLHVLVKPAVCLFAGSSRRPHRWRGGMADIETAAVEGDRNLVSLLIISDLTSANQHIDEYDTQPYTFAYIYERSLVSFGWSVKS